jgi:hypothetical protein
MKKEIVINWMCLNLNNGKERDERVRRDIGKIQISNFKLKKNEKGGGILSSCRSVFEEEGVRFLCSE